MSVTASVLDVIDGPGGSLLAFVVGFSLFVRLVSLVLPRLGLSKTTLSSLNVFLRPPLNALGLGVTFLALDAWISDGTGGGLALVAFLGGSTVAGFVVVFGVDWGIAALTARNRNDDAVIEVSPLKKRLSTAGAVLSVALIASVFQIDAVSFDGSWVVVLFLAIFPWAVLRGLYVFPYIGQLGYGGIGRSPTPAEHDRLQRCAEMAGISLEWPVVREVETLADAVAISGRDPCRWTAVHEEFLNTADDEALAVALARAEGKRRTGSYWYGVGDVVTSTLSLFTIFLLIRIIFWIFWRRDLWPELLLVFVVLGVLSGLVFRLARLSQRSELAADTFASERLGPETVCNVYKEYSEELLLKPIDRPGKSSKYTNLKPYFETRLQRLEQIESSANTPDEQVTD